MEICGEDLSLLKCVRRDMVRTRLAVDGLGHVNVMSGHPWEGSSNDHKALEPTGNILAPLVSILLIGNRFGLHSFTYNVMLQKFNIYFFLYLIVKSIITIKVVYNNN